MAGVSINGIARTPFRTLEFGDLFFYGSGAYVKTRPMDTGKWRINAIGVGHDDQLYLWHEEVTPLDAEMTPTEK